MGDARYTPYTKLQRTVLVPFILETIVDVNTTWLTTNIIISHNMKALFREI